MMEQLWLVRQQSLTTNSDQIAKVAQTHDVATLHQSQAHAKTIRHAAVIVISINHNRSVQNC